MLLSEEEARQKLCPFSVLSSSVQPCAGARCMAWRRHETPVFKSEAEAAFKRSGARMTPPGFCGLAGVPTCDERDYR